MASIVMACIGMTNVPAVILDHALGRVLILNHALGRVLILDHALGHVRAYM